MTRKPFLNELTRSDRLDWIDLIGSTRSDRLDLIEFWIKGLASWPNFKLFRPKLSPNRTKNGWFLPFLPFLVRFGLNLGLNNLKFDQEAIFEWIDSIGSKFGSKIWLPGQILSCLDLNWSDRSDWIERKNGWFLPFLVRFGLNIGKFINP